MYGIRSIITIQWDVGNACASMVIHKEKATTLEQPFFSKEKELPRVGFEPMALCSLGMSALPTELPGQLSR